MREPQVVSPLVASRRSDSCVFPEHAGALNVVLSCMFGGGSVEAQDEVRAMTEQQLRELAYESLSQSLGVWQEPNQMVFTPWTEAIPQPDAHYHASRRALEAALGPASWLATGGKAFGRGVGVNDSIESALCAADKVVEALRLDTAATTPVNSQSS